MGAEEDPYGPLWITRLTRYFWIDKFTERAGINDFVRRAGNSSPAETVGIDRYIDENKNPQVGPYVFVLVVVFIDLGILSSISYLNGKRPHDLTIPTLYFVPLGLLFGVWAIRMFARVRIRDSYTPDQFASLDGQLFEFLDGQLFDSSDGQLYDIRKTYFKNFIFSSLLILHIVNLFVFGEFSAFVEQLGLVVSSFKFLIFGGVIYTLIVAELSGIIAASFVSVPFYFAKHNYKLSFDDPLDVGGLKKVGDLIKTAFYIYAVGLILIIIFIYSPAILQDFIPDPPYNPQQTYKVLQFVIAWGAGISFVLIGTATLHSYMEKQKEKKIEEIHSEICDLGDYERAIPNEVADEQTKTELQLKYLQLEQVKATRTLPFTAATQERVLFTAAAPLVLERLLNFIII